ncbi:outer membrane protein assembly factor BamB family protein [Mongoliitalea daihaiensis]|uniref:outer membrane protein assembly factor BamB family protein n=1 Tax=Mongoliitalea daihaiensis TaxID=2782006 RepID=UPI001F3C7D64|nr:PQQ-binding-like beta-propeller repeat protein [Mongoliitalea daihaiensis]UJP65359.1 PQQ-binding-like beta-propeller repeat protein [Mongoliitalea daihaiensis]
MKLQEILSITLMYSLKKKMLFSKPKINSLTSVSYGLILGLLFTFSVSQVFAQNGSDWVISTDFTPRYTSFSNDGKYIILENENQYQVWNLQSKQQVLQGNYRNKVGRSIPGVGLTEGSAFLLFEQEEIFLQFDYTLAFTTATAFDLNNGKEKWVKNDLDIGISTVESIYQIFSNAQRLSQDKETLSEVTFSAVTGINTVSKKNNIPVSYVGHDERLNKLITYFPEKNAIAVNGKDGLQLLEIDSGEVLWQQPELKGGLGEVFYEPNNDLIIAIRVSQTELQNIAGRPEVQALNAQNGDLIWSLKYSGDFIPSTAFVRENVLLLPYFGLTLIDITTGEEMDSDVKEGMQRHRRMYRNMSVLGAGGEEGNTLGDNSSYPLIDENNIIHYVVGMQGGRHIDPDGSRKSYLQIDFNTGEIILHEEKIARQNNRVIQEELTGGMLYLKMTNGLSGSYIVALDTKNGQIAFETEKVSNRLGTDFDPFVLDGDKIVDASSQGIHTYDAKTGETLSTISYKKFEVGRLKNQIAFDNGLILIGTDGVAIADNEGNVQTTFEGVKEIKDLILTEKEIWLVEKNRFFRVGTEPIEILEEVKFDKNENVFFSPEGTYLVRVNATGRELNIFQME